MRPLSRRSLFALPLALPAVVAAAAKSMAQPFAMGGPIDRVAAPLICEAAPETIKPKREVATLIIKFDDAFARDVARCEDRVRELLAKRSGDWRD